MAKYCGLHNRLDTQETENWGALLRCCPLYTGGILLAADCASTTDYRQQVWKALLQTVDCVLWTVDCRWQVWKGLLGAADYGLQTVYLEGSIGVLDYGVYTGKLLEREGGK